MNLTCNVIFYFQNRGASSIFFKLFAWEITFCLCYMSIVMSLVYWYALRVEKDALKYMFPNHSEVSIAKQHEITRRVMLQGIRYAVALVDLCISFILPVFSLTYLWAILMSSIAFPLQCIFNSLINMLPIYFNKWWRKDVNFVKRHQKEMVLFNWQNLQVHRQN